ncbi:hypothetical protein GLOTRDRAFT_68702 [Gloeophyllum trabeum ATCC 11539]|uniref:Uncharacterized protein n=1 Tax=Gloeophyllum trabeum (strain ATCC 11539 / FP-39264 / Madison 617) TaxID=670483 RepID=S7QMS0_GLOTA|nr:uncharacterized protein GLOTRDRAFT_68702 [Gloeophyllum trabeum ATCC 11539]EPQ60773.1 hypothetical protein GLOTRDRAFT_68702 [Gloeophyllum trabeum ATCC 11539]
MVEPVARIRLYKPSEEDDKLVRFVLGKAYMGLLAEANQRAYFHPLMIASWVAMSCIFIQVMHWWPDYDAFGWLSFLKPLPAFASMAVPFMFFIDWRNRPAFEKLTQNTLRKPDIFDIASYYSRSPASGLWILEYGQSFVGLIAVDASPDSTSEITISADTTCEFTSGTSAVATIRHFHVEEKYRKSGVQDDLLEHALRRTFESAEQVQKVRIVYCPLATYIGECLRKYGFRTVEHTSVSGVSFEECALDRSAWEKKSI